VTHTGGSPTLPERIGGLAGCIEFRGNITNSFSTGLVTVSVDRTRYGGLNGFIGTGGNVGTTVSSFWDTQTSGQTTSASGTGKTTAEMKTQATFTGWDFTTIWDIDSGKNDGYPHLRWYYDVTPQVTSVELYQSDRAVLTTAMSPQVEYAVKVTVNCPNTLAGLGSVTTTLFSDADGIYTAGEVPLTGNTQNAAILTCTVGPTPSWSIDAGSGTTWSIIPANCTQPSLAGTSGDFWFHFRPGKVATETTGSAKWHIHAAAAGTTGTGTGYKDNYLMNWYGEISVNTVNVDFGTVLPGSDFTTSNRTGISITCISNGNYLRQIKSVSPWSGNSSSISLNKSGNPGEAEFSMRADDSAVLENSSLVTTGYVTSHRYAD
jgi:hypothetical protein